MICVRIIIFFLTFFCDLIYPIRFCFLFFCLQIVRPPSFFFFFLNDPATPEISPLSLHAPLPICRAAHPAGSSRPHLPLRQGAARAARSLLRGPLRRDPRRGGGRRQRAGGARGGPHRTAARGRHGISRRRDRVPSLCCPGPAGWGRPPSSGSAPPPALPAAPR